MADEYRLKISRRSLLKKTAAGAAAASALAATASWGVLAPGAPGEVSHVSQSDDVGPAGSGPLVAYVRDAAKGEVAFLVGTEEVVRNDPVLVSRLLAAMRTA